MLIIERIYHELEKQNLKASALCSHVGISTAQLSTWKKRGTDPKAIYIPKIAEFLSVSPNYILTGKKDEGWQPTVTNKDEKDIKKKIDDIKNQLASETGLMYDGAPIDDESQEAILAAIEVAERTAILEAKRKFTPDKYKK